MENNNNNRNDQSSGGSSQGGSPRFNSFWIYGIIAQVILVVQILTIMGASQQKLSQDKLGTMLKNQEISKIEVINGTKALIYLNEKGLKKYPD